MIERVEYSRVQNHLGQCGISVAFIFDTDNIDLFEFFEQSDIDYLMRFLVDPVTPEEVMLAIRNRAKITVH